MILTALFLMFVGRIVLAAWGGTTDNFRPDR